MPSFPGLERSRCGGPAHADRSRRGDTEGVNPLLTPFLARLMDDRDGVTHVDSCHTNLFVKGDPYCPCLGQRAVRHEIHQNIVGTLPVEEKLRLGMYRFMD